MNLKRFKIGDIFSYRDSITIVEKIEYIGADELVNLIAIKNNGEIVRYSQWLRLDDKCNIWYGTPKENAWIKSGGHLICRGVKS